jgi:hypothetical protein
MLAIDAADSSGQQPARGVAKMSLTGRQPAPQRGGRRPASFADGQLRHLESVLGYVTREGAAQPDEFDHAYWAQRILALEDSHELVASQRMRIAKLRDLLGMESKVSAARRTTA